MLCDYVPLTNTIISLRSQTSSPDHNDHTETGNRRVCWQVLEQQGNTHTQETQVLCSLLDLLLAHGPVKMLSCTFMHPNHNNAKATTAPQNLKFKIKFHVAPARNPQEKNNQNVSSEYNKIEILRIPGMFFSYSIQTSNSMTN